ncbi:ABC transporter ATP-binding protein [Solibacillus sp. MA9]|uniref:ABC transporter ATP-binding protein n=1 Tax=Solibacillus palustris TaxID=2908203 RepID=A0ABS9UD62_9BACL|nr:ABC transporter ATP-binding protein [Solibacillus sp. MA9]MCH7321908.1 ABC transporter ATP-binding protein [Solibacillus sp. MA9]
MLQLHDVNKAYASQTVLQNLSISFEFGQCYLLLGENGAGKSTLFKCIVGDEPINGGSITLNGEQNVADLAALQYQFFDSYTFLKVHEVISLFTKLLDQPANVKELYDILDLADFEKTLIKNCSGGQRKALSLYLAFLLNKPVVLLDEPFADLDLKKKKQLITYLRGEIANDKCLIIISHEIAGFESLFDVVCVMKDGHFIEIGSSKELQKKYVNPVFPGLEGVYFEITGQVLGGAVR